MARPRQCLDAFDLAGGQERRDVVLDTQSAGDFAAGLGGIGQGRATASAAEAMARNPGAIAAIRVALILGLVLIESLALYTLVIIFVKVV